MTTIGLDIGGANLKAADGRGLALQRPFALWRHPEQLSHELRELTRAFGRFDQIAITMTGELCDCFSSKVEGVLHIVASAVQAFPEKPIRVWTTQGRFASLDEIAGQPLNAAAANWLALATFAGRFLPAGPGLVLDLGSTTTDIVPLLDGRPCPQGRSDPERMAADELVYCGVRRTPLCAIFGLSKAAEFFATTEDVYLVLGDLAEEPARTESADGRGVTKEFARARLARMECDEAAAWTWERTVAFARSAKEIHVRRIAEAVSRVVKRGPALPRGIVTAGAGEFLWPEILTASGLDQVPRISLTNALGTDHSVAACAHAVAVLGQSEVFELSPNGRGSDNTSCPRI